MRKESLANNMVVILLLLCCITISNAWIIAKVKPISIHPSISYRPVYYPHSRLHLNSKYPHILYASKRDKPSTPSTVSKRKLLFSAAVGVTGWLAWRKFSVFTCSKTAVEVLFNAIGAAGKAEDNQVAKEVVDREINQYPCVVFGFNGCPYTSQVATDLSARGNNVRIVNLDEKGALAPQILSELGRRSGGEAHLPQVWLNGQYSSGKVSGKGES